MSMNPAARTVLSVFFVAGVGAFGGAACGMLPAAMAAGLGAAVAMACAFAGGMAGFAGAVSRYGREHSKLVKEHRELRSLVMDRIDRLGVFVTSVSQAVATRVAARMVDEMYRNISSSDEQKEAALMRGQRIVSEEVSQLAKSIEEQCRGKG